MKLLKYGNRAIAIKENGEIKLLFDNIPMKVSELENDLEYTTKTYVETLVNSIPKLSVKVVEELPLENIDPSVIYLVKKSEQENELYEEFIYVNDQWESLGKARIDLAPYVTEEELQEILKNYSPSTGEGNSSPILYSLPLGEASWLRIAKVSDVTKTASGIVTFNCYAYDSEDKRETLTTSTFSTNCGLDKNGIIIGDILPLSSAPQLTGSSGSGGSAAPIVSSDGSGSGSGTFGLIAVTIEEYEDEIYLCGLVSFPNVEMYKSFEVEMLIENNINFSPLETFEPVDLTFVKSLQPISVLEGVTLKDYTPYQFVLKGNLEEYVNNIENGNPLQVDIEYEGKKVEDKFNYFQWGTSYIFTREESLDKVINDVQYYGYQTTMTPDAWSESKCLVKDEIVFNKSKLYDLEGNEISYGGSIETKNKGNEKISLIKYTKEIVKQGMTVWLWGITDTFTREESLDKVINDVQYYGYQTDGKLYDTTKLWVLDEFITLSSVLYDENGELFYPDNAYIESYVENAGSEYTALFVNGKEMLTDGRGFGHDFFDNFDEIRYYKTMSSSSSASGERICKFDSEDIKNLIRNYSLRKSTFTTSLVPDNIIKNIEIIYNYGENDNVDGVATQVLLNGQFVSDLNYDNRLVIIENFDIEKDVIEIYVPEGNYTGFGIGIPISNFQYEIVIPYELTETKVIKQYEIAENNPYNLQFTITELVKHNTIGSVNVYSVYEKVEKLEDDLSKLDTSLSSFAKTAQPRVFFYQMQYEPMYQDSLYDISRLFLKSLFKLQEENKISATGSAGFQGPIIITVELSGPGYKFHFYCPYAQIYRTNDVYFNVFDFYYYSSDKIINIRSQLNDEYTYEALNNLPDDTFNITVLTGKDEENSNLAIEASHIVVPGFGTTDDIVQEAFYNANKEYINKYGVNTFEKILFVGIKTNDTSSEKLYIYSITKVVNRQSYGTFNIYYHHLFDYISGTSYEFREEYYNSGDTLVEISDSSIVKYTIQTKNDYIIPTTYTPTSSDGDDIIKYAFYTACQKYQKNYEEGSVRKNDIMYLYVNNYSSTYSPGFSFMYMLNTYSQHGFLYYMHYLFDLTNGVVYESKIQSSKFADISSITYTKKGGSVESSNFATTSYVDEAIANAITNVLNTEV